VGDFSSRGPTADGRVDPDVTANGLGSFVHLLVGVTASGGLTDCRAPAAVSCTTTIVFVTGTSFSSPTVAGAAALVRAAVSDASAVEVRNAIQESANPALFGDGSKKIDRGQGFLDVPAAIERLESGAVSPNLPYLRDDIGEDPEDALGRGGSSVIRNIGKAGYKPVEFDHKGRFTTRITNLRPGQVAHFFVPSDALTESLSVQLTNIVPALPPEQQNQLFGDDLLVHIVDAPTSFAETRAAAFVSADQVFTVDRPQTGLVRVAVMGDWTNAGRISTTLTITRTRKLTLPSTLGIVRQDDQIPFEFDVPAGTTALEFKLAWLQNWGRYPTNDIDLLLIDPAGNMNVDGATIASPEQVTIANPTPGRWTAVVQGFTLHDLRGEPEDEDNNLRFDAFTLRATANGKLLKARR
jgi:hypothetical protein